MRSSYFFVILVIILIFSFNCKKEAVTEKKIDIITTVFPIYDFVKEVGKEHVNVTIITPPGTEPHSYEPTPKDIVKINESNLFLYIGDHMEVWIPDILHSLKNSNTEIVSIIDGMNVFDDGDNYYETTKDPHIWLDFEIDQRIVSGIAKILSQIDIDNKDFYNENARIYNEKLASLDKNYKNFFERTKSKTIVFGGHFAFGHFTKRYGLNYVSPYSGFGMNVETSPQNIANLIEFIQKNSVSYIFFEELLEPKIAKEISKETQVKIELLHAAHNLSKDEFDKKLSFIEIMDTNLVKLEKSLK